MTTRALRARGLGLRPRAPFVQQIHTLPLVRAVHTRVLRHGTRPLAPGHRPGPQISIRPRHISFLRVLPSLALKLVRLPAMLGAVTVAGLSYLQYQAVQAGTYITDILGRGRDAVGTVWSTAEGVLAQTRNGVERTRAAWEPPSWLSRAWEAASEWQENKSEDAYQSKTSAAVAGAAVALTQNDEEARDDQMMVLTRKMIEIRSILQDVGQASALILPSIVVIGSQSSGKSSVLEAIVGHEFLPKGSNMITRRPIELTLVNTPESQTEYGEFPALGLGKVTDFTQIQKTLTDLNLAVPASQCVSDEPIQLTISSPHVPDLSLIDLPGYIQVAGADQPLELKQKISDLCDKYIQAPNVILAISAADVDLANSTALRASRRVDPRGERTIGVVTKMDLVDAQRGLNILTDRKYPLRLGYVGVVSRVPATTGLFSRPNITSAITKNENAFFGNHDYGPDVDVGTNTLRKKLMYVLEQTMASSLQGTHEAIQQELEEASYEFKVQYNDRPLSAESHLAESLDAFKHSFKGFAASFGRAQVRELLKAELDERVLDVLAQRYWNKPVNDLVSSVSEPDPLSSLPTADPESPYWHRKLDASTSSLTKLGVGRLATTVLANALQNEIERLLAASSFNRHPFARQAVTDAAAGILNERFYSTSDQVENCVKPYKFEIDIDDAEWIQGRKNAAKILKQELDACGEAIATLEKNIGGKKRAQDVVSFIDRVRSGEVAVEGDGIGGAGGFSAALLAKGREASFLQARSTILSLRLAALKSKPCTLLPSSRISQKGTDNIKRSIPAQPQYLCPEPFLDALATKLAATATLFLNVELLSEFYYNFPRELDARLGRGMSQSDLERFAREDSRIASHLDVVRRKEKLELVLRKMESLRSLEGEIGAKRTLEPGKDEPRNWRLF